MYYLTIILIVLACGIVEFGNKSSTIHLSRQETVIVCCAYTTLVTLDKRGKFEPRLH